MYNKDKLHKMYLNEKIPKLSKFFMIKEKKHN